ncbi:adenylate/guanylate cyclase domain-containing protein [Candidatus Parabeggiatoa sp. HSG14]|uniref:adenylate/guanylate cyclase domain-containing protein n=1 Tax=Candidatus Parabeggiatoa sp. HSG14 TaxID=3055593 RepID=UPI0025A7BAC6|nr:adenylate/guanylate cyclase domain-containing protein [Thiotrichales bacterium HSG14]
MPKIIYHCESEQPIILHHQADETILETSLNNGIAHYHECGGKGDCTTCRIRVLNGHQNITKRTDAELKIAQEKNWSDDIRLACQAKIHGDVTIRRLVIDAIDVDLISSESNSPLTGHERSLVVMFCDIANFSGFTTRHLPDEVVYLLNRYYKEVAEPIFANQGYIDKYMGDKLMALFGLENDDLHENCLNAVQASLQMQARVKALNKKTLQYFFHEYHVRIGLHYGSVIVGDIGHPSKRQLTVLGNAVNVASRVEAANKAFGTQILISKDLLSHIPNDVETGQAVTTQLGGQSCLHTLYEVKGIKDWKP